MSSKALLVALCLWCGSCREVASIGDIGSAADASSERVFQDGCVPSCTNKNCGADDGCGGRCEDGNCVTGQRCVAGACICDETSCNGCCAGYCFGGIADDSCGSGGEACDDCTSKSQACGADQRCFECEPDCDGKDCGADNGCGGACSTGPCPAGLTCAGGDCVCTPDSCPDGCCDASGSDCRGGGALEACGRKGELCQSCQAPDTCNAGVCKCIPVCPSCGIDDGCGNTCGCGSNEDCFNGTCEVVACQYCSTPSGDCTSDCIAAGSSGGSCGDIGSTDPANCCNCDPKSTGTASKGRFDSITNGNIWGWACDPDNPWTSIMVHVYVGGPSGPGTELHIIQARHQNEEAVKTQCGGGDYHRFGFTIPGWSAKIGQPVYVYGISVHGGGNSLLAGCPKLVN